MRKEDFLFKLYNSHLILLNEELLKLYQLKLENIGCNDNYYNNQMKQKEIEIMIFKELKQKILSEVELNIYHKKEFDEIIEKMKNIFFEIKTFGMEYLK